MENCKPPPSPLLGKLSRNNEEAQNDNENIASYPYRELIGSLMYIATTTRPDISFPVAYLSQFNEQPRGAHWIAAKRVLRYLQGTKDIGIT